MLIKQYDTIMLSITLWYEDLTKLQQNWCKN
jgi:hypothetical protein